MADTKSIIPLNFQLLLNPVNWIIVILMLLIVGFAVHLVMSLKTPPVSANQGS